MCTRKVVSIITPLFNRLDDISLTVQSVLQQTYASWQWIVVDDGSTDGSFESMKEWATRDKRIIVEKRQRIPKSASTCRNIGINLSTGDFIMFLDSDDLLAPQCLENRLNLIEDEDFIVTQTGIIRKGNKLIKKYWSSLLHENDLEAFLRLEGWCVSSTFFRSSFAKKYFFDEDAASLQDWGYHLRMLSDCPNYTKYPKSAPDVYVRSGHGDRISVKNRSTDRVKNRFLVFLKTEKHLSKAGHSAGIDYLDKHYLKHLKEIVLFQSHDDFKVLYDLWKESVTYQSKTGKLIRLYLFLQFWLKKLHLSFLNGLVYRAAKAIYPKRLFEPNQREFVLEQPFLLEPQLQVLLTSKS